jgi:lipopolysaccharide/colanic/teichoic acid biosynthesis glycosyltransferase
VAAGGLILLAPIIGALALLVWWRDRANPFFRQQRMGIDGRMFEIIKLRTMRPGAEMETGPTFAGDADPRCTPLGLILRQTHLDELPQLINVLRGEMSLVGPRPERPYFIQQFREDVPRYMARHRVRSGITGWAQVNGLCGRHGSIADRLKYDLYYIENWSLWLDIKILLVTLLGRQRPGPAGHAD